MGLFKKQPEKDEPARAEETRPAQTEPWTAGAIWGTRLATVGLWALLIIWPVAVATVVSGFGTAEAAPPAAEPMIRETGEQLAGAKAAALVGAWLSATEDDSSELGAFTDPSGMGLPEQPWVYRDLTVASVGKRTDAGLMPVQIVVDVQETSIAGDKPVTAWQERYFQVTVHVDGDAVSTVGLPAPVTAPAAPTKTPSLEYPARVSPTGPVAQTVEAFLQAYLAGTGDVARYISPGSEIAPITPAPFAASEIKSLNSDVEAAERPEDGTQLHVRVETDLVAGTGQRLTADYSLQLTARADRWEITAIEPLPVTTEPKK